MQTLCCKVCRFGNNTGSKEFLFIESNMLKRFRFALIFICLAFIGRANAQFDDPKTLEVGFHAGTSYYIGDLNPQKHFGMPDLEFGGVTRFNVNSRWTYRFDYTYANVKASDEKIAWRPERGLGFRSTIHDFSLIAEFNFLEYYTGNPKRNCSPYIFGGLSGFLFTSYCTVDEAGAELKPLKTEGKDYSSMSVSIPFGLGVKLALSKHIAATFEWRLQKTFTDYLDDCGTVYPENHAIGEDGFDYSDPTGNFLPGQQRGNSAFKDWFCEARVSFTWKFNLPDGRGCNLSKF